MPATGLYRVRVAPAKHDDELDGPPVGQVVTLDTGGLAADFATGGYVRNVTRSQSRSVVSHTAGTLTLEGSLTAWDDEDVVEVWDSWATSDAAARALKVDLGGAALASAQTLEIGTGSYAGVTEVMGLADTTSPTEPAVARELSITYGALTVGGDSPRYLLDHSFPRRVRGDYETVESTCTVQVQAATEADFVAACQALEEAFQTPNQDLTITLGSESWEWSHVDNTGFLARPSWEIVPDASNSARSRLYELTVAAQRPADLTGKNGLREATITISTALSGLRTITVTGSYTALAGTGAYSRATTGAPSVIAGVESALSGTWERGETSYHRDDEDKTCGFTVTSVELGFNQAIGTLNHKAIRQQTLTLAVARLAPGDAEGAQRLRDLRMRYDASIVRAETTNLPAFFAATILPHLMAIARDTAQTSAIALMSVAPDFDFPNNRISASLELQALSGSTTLIDSITTEDAITKPVQLVPVWDGNPYARARFQTPATWRRSVTRTRLMFGGQAGASADGSVPGSAQTGLVFIGPTQSKGLQSPSGLAAGGTFKGSGSAGGPRVYLGGYPEAGSGSAGASSGGTPGDGWEGEQAGWVLMESRSSERPYQIGLPEASMSLLELTETDIYEWAEPPSGEGVGALGYEGAGTVPRDATGGSLPGPGSVS